MRTGIAKKLTLSSLIGLRFLVPVVIYFFMVRWVVLVLWDVEEAETESAASRHCGILA